LHHQNKKGSLSEMSPFFVLKFMFRYYQIIIKRKISIWGINALGLTQIVL